MTNDISYVFVYYVSLPVQRSAKQGLTKMSRRSTV